MIRYERTKSSMFLMEILINILLFSLLCICSLQFFIKALNLTENTTTLQGACPLWKNRSRLPIIVFTIWKATTSMNNEESRGEIPGFFFIP